MDYTSKKDLMVETQLIPRGISDPRVIAAFRRVRRHEFVPEELAGEAYSDHPLPIGKGQTISQPYIAALMTQSLALSGSEKVLEIGTGSGYQAAILSTLAQEVCTVESDEHLLRSAMTAIGRQNIRNVKYRLGDGTSGWPEEAPFGGIIVTAGAPYIPDPLKQQLADGSRLVIPVGDLSHQVLTVVERAGDGFRQYDICPCIFVPLRGRFGWGE